MKIFFPVHCYSLIYMILLLVGAATHCQTDVGHLQIQEDHRHLKFYMALIQYSAVLYIFFAVAHPVFQEELQTQTPLNFSFVQPSRWAHELIFHLAGEVHCCGSPHVF